jgi:uncharacterized membrane protein YidH (DUF202 family)
MGKNLDISFSGAANSDSFIILLSVVLAFMLISLWHDAILQIYYDILGFDRTNPMSSFILAIFMSILVVTVFICIHCSTKGECP